MEWISLSPTETLTLGGKILQEFPDHRVICLKGPLGSGKTCFTKGVGSGLGIKENRIKSPTFTTVLEHRTEDAHLIHCDFYRLENHTDLDYAWWSELSETPDSILVIEWSEKIEPHLPIPRLEVEFHDLGEDQRKLCINTII